MKIGVASLGKTSEDTGGRNYIEHFFRTLSTFDHGHEFVLFLSDDEASKIDLGPRPPAIISLRNTSASALRKVIGEQIFLPLAIKAAKIELMYYPGNFASYACPVPYVLNIRAVAHYYGRHYGIDWARRTMRKLLMPFSASGAERIITPSQDIKNDVVRFTGARREKIEVIPHGVDTTLFDGEVNRADLGGSEVLKRYGLRSNEYLLYVSALWRYKNQDKLIRAHAELVRQKKIKLPLVIAGLGTGTEPSYLSMLYAMPEALGTKDLVIFTGQLPQSDLRYLYANARAFVFPSAYESFGNPIFESWASGIPIATANVHSFPEVVADAGVLFDPKNEQTFEEAILRVALDETLRKKIVALGKERVRTYTWERSVGRTLSVLESVKPFA